MKRYAPIVAIILLFMGCGDKKEDKQQSYAAAETSGHIEVTKNADAYKQKIENKSVDKEQSKSYYYDYNTNKKKASDKKRTAMDANLHIRSPYEQVEIEMMVHKLSKDFIVKCSACHNDYANGIIGPSLLDKDAKFIYGTIAKYKTGQKENVLMTALVKQMSDKEIKKLANEIAEFNAKIDELRSKRGNGK